VKRFLLMLTIALLGVSFVAGEADAKRLGGGASSGMKRTTPPPQQAQPQTPPQQAPAQAQPGQAGAAAGAMAAAPAKRSWLGPVAGLAAGLGLAALASHFGFGGDLANLMTMLLLAGVVFFAIRFAMRRFLPAQGQAAAAQRMAYAGAPAAGLGSAPLMPEALATTSTAAGASTLPSGFDAAGFERIAKLIFIRMQAANDTGDLEDLRRFSTPEMFATFRLELQDRPATPQRTDVVRLDAQVIDFAQEPTQQVVSVRFHGLIREEADGAAAPFDEVWHLVKPTDGSREWAIAGIAQSELA